MTQTRQERLMGRDIWKVLHIIAVNFPDGPKEGLSQQRLKGYYDFFNSLKYVLPRSAWRDTWNHATAGGDTELAWTSFQTLRDHRNLSRWLFSVHDSVRDELKQPKSKDSYAKLYASYRKYRRGVRQSNTTDARNTNTDPIGIGKLKALLPSRAKAMDAYLGTIYGATYATWPQARKEAARKTHLNEAAAWFWTIMSDRAAKADPTFNSLDAAHRRNRIVTQFDYNYRLRHQRLMNTVYGIKGSILDRLKA